MRRLYYVPVIHSQADFGEAKILEFKRRLYSKEKIEETERSIRAYWEKAERELFRRLQADKVDRSSLQIYADSFPVVPDHILREALHERCRRGMFWCLIIQKLIDKGATLEGTEDLQLYLKEARAVMEAIESGDAQSPYAQRLRKRSDIDRIQSLLKGFEERDRFIAKRIDETLRDTGVLFMGLGHKVVEILTQLEKEGLLSSPIRIICL